MAQYTIDAGTFARNAIQAIHAGEVAFLDKGASGHSCRYYYPDTGKRCIIGAGLPIDQAIALDKAGHTGIGGLLRDRVLVVTSDYCEPEALRATLCDLQMRHDMEMNPSRTEAERLESKIYMLTELELLADLHPEPAE